MLVSPIAIHELRRRLNASPGPVRTATIDIDVSPLEAARSGSALFGSAIYVAVPGGPVFAGLGVARRISASGTGRFEHLEHELVASTSDSHAPWFLGFSFSPEGPRSVEWAGFYSADLVRPQLTFADRNGLMSLTVSVPAGVSVGTVLDGLAALQPPLAPLLPDPGDHTVESHPPVSEWRSEVGEAVSAIRAGSLAKVVLTRSVVIRSESAADGFDLVSHLGAAYPQCYAFGWQRDGAVFVGASPELLISRRGDRIRTNPLAGSAERGEGEEEDLAVGRALMASEKDRLEHAIVVDDIAARLGELTAELTVPAAPSLRRMASVQHLSTDITGRLRSPMSVLALADVLHPTPAVGGTPRSEAVAFIDKVETADRGWYTGGIGWVDAEGDGDVALSLRCGLVRGNTAHLFAGAGIVAESDPDRELVETRLKFRPLLSLLAAT